MRITRTLVLYASARRVLRAAAALPDRPRSALRAVASLPPRARAWIGRRVARWRRRRSRGAWTA
jgi:hypothetical protein